MTNKKKLRPFEYGQIVRHGNTFGHITDTHNGITVRFPDPSDINCDRDVLFHENGTLLGTGERTLFHAEQPKGIDEVCREMSRKLEDVTKRISKVSRKLGTEEADEEL